MCVCMCVSRWMWMHYVWACKHTHNADDYNSTLLGDSSTIVERSRLSELWSNNSAPLPLYKRIQYGHIYHYCSPCAQLASCYLEWVLEINPAKLCFAGYDNSFTLFFRFPIHKLQSVVQIRLGASDSLPSCFLTERAVSDMLISCIQWYWVTYTLVCSSWGMPFFTLWDN